MSTLILIPVFTGIQTQATISELGAVITQPLPEIIAV